MCIKNFYTTQSRMTDPGRYAFLFDDLPDAIPELCRIVQLLFMHYADEAVYEYKIPVERYREMDDRSVEVMLARMMALDARPLTEIRQISHRVIGVCRDTSILLCAILRHKKIPARLRTGFANYFIPDFNLDGVIVEYWNENHQKWLWVDTRTSDEVIKKNKYQVDFDLYDLPSEKFIPAEIAWQLCRAGEKKSNHFGSRLYRGLWCVRNRMLQELALINKHEMLVWDLWGLMLSRKNHRPLMPEYQYPILDNLALVIQKNKSESIALYQENPGLAVPAVVANYNPFFKRRFDHVSVS